MDYFVSSTDLQSIFKNCKIIKYADLDNYNDIYMLLPKRMDFCFILTESETNSGHWTLLIRDDKNFQYYDSYGVSPKNILDYIPNYMNKKLGNNYLSRHTLLFYNLGILLVDRLMSQNNPLYYYIKI